MLRFARDLRKNPTNAERLLWSHLRRRQMAGFKFRRQHSVGPYICDFACVEASVVVELDGSQHVEQSDYDFRRDRFLRSNGFRILRFWNDDVLRSRRLRSKPFLKHCIGRRWMGASTETATRL
jgi:very-short-patch-repair endonuclease